MKMKSCLMAVALLFIGGQAVFSQSLKEAKQDLYYKHYLDASKSLSAMTAPNDKSKNLSRSESEELAHVYYYLGVTQTEMDSLDAAASSFKTAKAVARKNEFPLAAVGLGRIDIMKGNYDAAKQKFQSAWDESKGRDMEVLREILKATALDPEADAKYVLGLVDEFRDDRRNRKYELTAEDYTAIGDVYAHLPQGGGKAATNFETALRKDPGYAKAAYKLGNLWDRARQDSLARMNWKKAVEADPKFSPAVYELYTYYRIRDLSQAEKYLNDYMKLTDDKLNAKVNLVDIMYLQKNYQEAIDSARQLMERPINEKTRTRLYKLIAVSQMEMDEFEKAKKNMDTYFDNTPEEDRLPFDYKTYADIMEKLGNDEMQLEYLNKYVNADTSTNIKFIRETANKLRKDNNFKAAELWFHKLFDVADTNQVSMGDYYYRALSNYGAALHGSGTYDEAVASWERFIEKYPDQPSGYFYKGRTLARKDTGLVGLGVEAYNQYISKLKPEELEDKKSTLKSIYSYDAKCAAKQDDFPNAIKYVEKLLEIDPNSAVAANIYGSIALSNLKERNLEEASKFAKKALAIDEGNTVAPQVLDYVQQLKDYQKKKAAYEKAKAEREQQQ